MSKAFTRESDDEPERSSLRPLSSPLPPGARNYITPDGAGRMRVELEQLSEEKRAQVAAAEQSGEPQPKVSLLEQRIRRLRESLETAVVVPAPPQPWNQVRFGANVTVKDAEGSETTYRIVGIDETDLERNWISWLSPLARALLNGQLGAQLRFHLPAGEQRLEIIRIDFKPGLDETGKGA